MFLGVSGGRLLDRFVVSFWMWRDEDMSQRGGSGGGEERRKLWGSKKLRELFYLLRGVREGGRCEVRCGYLGIQGQEVFLKVGCEVKGFWCRLFRCFFFSQVRIEEVLNQSYLGMGFFSRFSCCSSFQNVYFFLQGGFIFFFQLLSFVYCVVSCQQNFLVVILSRWLWILNGRQLWVGMGGFDRRVGKVGD